MRGTGIKYLKFPSNQDNFPSGFDASRVLSLPEGDWNIGTFANKDDSNEIIIYLDSVVNLWHPRCVDSLDLVGDGGWGSFDVQVDRCDMGPGLVTVMMDWWPLWTQGPKFETEVHGWIQGAGVGPKFLALTENNHNRVIGFVVEKINGHAATNLDLPPCQSALSQLHRCDTSLVDHCIVSTLPFENRATR